MKAMVLESYGNPLVLRDVPIPEVGPQDVLLRVKACGVCGTDLKISSGRIATTHVPVTMGHEPMGVVVEVGKDVQGVKVGDRVIVSIYQPCGDCKFCLSGRHTLCLNLKGRTGFELDGGFAEYLRVPAVNVVKVPDNIGDNEAAILSCGVATPFHGLRARAKVKPGDNVLIMGVGGLGIHAVQVARLCGARVIAVDIVEEHLTMAKEYGADEVLAFDQNTFVSKILDLTRTGATVIFETVGHPSTIEESLRALEPGGKLVMAGYYPGEPFAGETPLIVLKELEIMGTRAINKQELIELVSLTAEGRIAPVVTGSFGLEEVNSIMQQLTKGKITGRVVINP